MASLTLPLVLAGAVASAAVYLSVGDRPCVLACLFSCGEAPASAAPADTRVVADVVEARSASVFAGACHYNGELMTQGAEALLAVRVESGTSQGVDLSGVSAAALVSSTKNLKLDGERKSVVYVSDGASAAQRERIVALLGERAHGGLGEVVAVESAPVRVTSDAGAFRVEVGERIALSGAPMPDRACCKQPSLVWYEPLVPLKQRLVGFTQSWSVDEPRLDLRFTRAEENSAFLGSLTEFEGSCAAE